MSALKNKFEVTQNKVWKTILCNMIVADLNIGKWQIVPKLAYDLTQPLSIPQIPVSSRKNWQAD